MINKIFVIHHTHFDIGFTDQPEEVVRQQLNYLDRALSFCEQDPDYRWTIESGRLLREWLASRPQQMQERMLKMLRDGRLEVGALDMQLLTETATFSDMVENTRRITELGRQYGFPVKTAILDDIGGLAGEFPTALAACGVRYLVLGTGVCQTEVPWADLPYLFYLKAASGHRILVWNLGCDRQQVSCEEPFLASVYGTAGSFLGYHAFPEYLHEKDMGISQPLPGEDAEQPMPAKEVFGKLLERIQRNGYPYETLLLQYGGDNRPPSPKMAEFIRTLNRSGDFPCLKLSTPTAFFQEMEELYGDKIPELTGLLTDPWNLRINAVPSVLKKARAAQRLEDYLKFQGCADDELLENLLLVSDHTLGLNIWGWQTIAAESNRGIRDEHFDQARTSWERKALYAGQALRLAQELEHRQQLPQAETQAVVVKNLAPHPTCGPVELYLASYGPRLQALTDENGTEIPRQLVGQNRWLIQAPMVPGLGSKRLYPVFDVKYDDFYKPLANPVPETIQCGRFSLSFADGVLRQIIAPDGQKMLAGTGFLAEPLLEIIHDLPQTGEFAGLKESRDRTVLHLQNLTSQLTADGPLFSEITTSGMLGEGFASLRLRIYKNMERIDIRCRLDIRESTDKRCFYLHLPFAGETANRLFDQNAGLATLDKLLPGAMQDLFLCDRFLVQKMAGKTAVLCCPDAPVLEFGGMNTARWRNKLPYLPQNNSVYVMLANSVCNTDAPAWSDILESFDFSLFLHDGTTCGATEAQAHFETVIALSAEISYAEETVGISGLSAEIRLHSSGNGFWLENLTDQQVQYHFNLAEKTYTGVLLPRQLAYKEL